MESNETTDYSKLAINFFNDLKTMPYYRNYAAASGAVHNISKHEDAVKDILIKHGFKQIPKPKKVTNKTIADWITNPSLAAMPVMSFITQPCGPNDNPDFIVKIKNNAVIGLECKSSSKKTNHPMYNSGGLSQNYVYVYSSEATNNTTIYMGKDIVTVEQQQDIDQHILSQRKRDEILNEQLRLKDKNHRGISYYTRPMIQQSGGAGFTDYFAHANREKSEQSVLDFIQHMILNSYV